MTMYRHIQEDIDKIRAWVDSKICPRCWRSRIPFPDKEDPNKPPAADCTCGGADARQDELDRRHQQSITDADETAELHKWRDRMRGKGWLS